MGTIHQFDPSSGIPRIKDAGGGGEPPMELLERIIKLEASLLPVATREHVTHEVASLRADMHKELGSLRSEFHKSMSDQTWKFITWVTGIFLATSSALVGAVYLIVNNN